MFGGMIWRWTVSEESRPSDGATLNGHVRLGPNAPQPYIQRDPEPSAADIAWVDKRIKQEALAREARAEAARIKREKETERQQKMLRDSGFLGSNYWHETYGSWAWKNSPDKYQRGNK